MDRPGETMASRQEIAEICNDSESLNMILVMGVTGSGKSHFINTLAGRAIVEEGDRLDSCKPLLGKLLSWCIVDINSLQHPAGTQLCQMVPVDIGNTHTFLIDTPGFDDTTRPDSEILSEIADILTIQYESGMKLKGIIYLHRITDIRYGRSAVRTFDIFRRLCGDEALKNVLLVTSRWSEVQESLGASRECDLRDRFWAYMLRRGSHMSRFHGDRDSAIGLVSQLLVKGDCILDLQREISEQGKSLDQTNAGFYVNDNLEKLKAQCKEELESLESLRMQLLQDELEMRRQVQRDWEAQKAKLEAAEQQQGMLQHNVAGNVRSKVHRMKSRLAKASRLVSFIPPVIEILGMFVGIPPGVPSMIAAMFNISSASFSFLSS